MTSSRLMGPSTGASSSTTCLPTTSGASTGLRWDAQTSMLKTLAAKHQSTVAKMAAKHRAKVETPYGLRTCFEARVERPGKQPLVARFGGIPLVCKRDAVLIDRVPSHQVTYPRKELVRRLLSSKVRAVRGTGQGGSAPGPETRQPP